MEKRGQLTIFIIVALVVIGFVVLFFAFQNNLIQQPTNPNADRVSNFVKDCIEQEGIKAVYQVGRNGGYFFAPNKSTESGIAIYYELGKVYIPSKKQVEDEISFLLGERVFFCTNYFENFLDINVTDAELSIKTDIQNEKVIFNVDYPITIAKGESKSTLKNFNVEIPIRAGIVYNSVAEFMRNQTAGNICLSCLSDILTKNNIQVDMRDYDEDKVVFIFKDENSKINNETFAWIFANDYRLI